MAAVRTVLVANRGEIALRVVRTCRVLGLRSVAAHSEADGALPFVVEADAAVCIGPAPARESYLSIPRILEAAKRSGAEAVHPGYGFLSENPDFADAVEKEGLVFIGPRAESIRALGNKVRAKEAAAAAGVPVLPGCAGLSGGAGLLDAAARVGFPLLLKAAAGGGGRGMRVVEAPGALEEAFATASAEALAAFGRADLFAERLMRPARHVEVQVFGDGRGRVVALGERECSVQRRHQKVIEEAPAPGVDRALRQRLCAAAEAVARSADYRGAGTVEFLLGPGGEFFFLEMNCRLQVEHPVTEAVLGADLVAAQLHLAVSGDMPDLPPPEPRGHAFECRVNAEDPARGFAPSTGPILALEVPTGGAVRFDGGYEAGDEVTPHYDSLLGKLVCWGASRPEALERAREALAGLVVLGPRTNVSFLRAVLDHAEFRAGGVSTTFLDERFADWTDGADGSDAAILAAALAALAGSGAGTPRGPGGRGARRPSPWEALGGWRVGR